MTPEEFKKIRDDVLHKHYGDYVHYSTQPGNVASDIKSGIHMVKDALEPLSLDGSPHDICSEASRLLYALYQEFGSRPDVQSDKTDKHGFTCAVLKRCAEDFQIKAQ